MFTDIVGFSAMMQRDEGLATMIRIRHREVFKETHEVYAGKILQYFGDGTLSIFESTAAAVECAVAMQVEFQQYPDVPLRIGIHTGDISYDEDGAFGDGVNIASRIEKLCVPCGIFISAKVYDDIKNHPWLEALSLGFFQLRNIFHELEIFAITSKGLPIPEPEDLQAYPEARLRLSEEAEVTGHKSKKIAAAIAFFLGVFGVHRFYLGQTFRGIVHFILAVLAIIITANEEFPAIAIVALIGFIDFVLLLAMSRHDFDRKYNTIKAKKRKKRGNQNAGRGVSYQQNPGQTPTQSRSQYGKKTSLLQEGKAAYRQGNHTLALAIFQQALQLEPASSVAIHFNIACCYSSLRETDHALEHLELAVKGGLDDYSMIQEHAGLSYIRRLEEFETFVNNGYKRPSQLPSPEANIIEDFDTFNPAILDKIEDLGMKLENGELSREEFEEQKRQILESPDQNI